MKLNDERGLFCMQIPCMRKHEPLSIRVLPIASRPLQHLLFSTAGSYHFRYLSGQIF